MLEVRHFGMDADKSARSGFGRTECGAKPEPQGCGEPIQRPRKANFGLLHCPNDALIQASSYRPWPGYRHPCRYDGISGSAGLVYNGERRATPFVVPALVGSMPPKGGATNAKSLPLNQAKPKES